MPALQQLIDWLLRNREKIFRYFFIPQLLVAVPFLAFAYGTGKVHAHLLFTGAHTRGKIVGFKRVTMHSRSNGETTAFVDIIYEPTVEFSANNRLVRFQEFKGQASNAGLGFSVPVIYDPNDPAFAMIDRSASNWLPWFPCFLSGFVLVLAAIKGVFVFFFRPQPKLSQSWSQ